MDDTKIKAAVAEAKRFISKAKELDAAKARGREAGTWEYCPRESGALRRASMDLTRALADMRRPEY